MKKIIYILFMLVFILQVVLAQGTRPVIVRFHNGNALKGEISRLPNDNRLRLQAPNGRVVLFSPSEVSSITYEDGTRVTNIPLAPQQGQQNRQGAQQGQPNQSNRQGQQQTQPNQQNRQGQAQQGQPNQQYRQGQGQQGQPNQQYRQGQPNQQNRQTQPNQQNRQGQPNQQNRQAQSQQGQTNRQNNSAQTGTNRNAGNDDFFFDDEGSDIVLKPTDRKQAQAAQSPADKPENAFSAHPKALIDFGYTLGMGDEFNKASRLEFTLSYGVQATEALFIGIGSGIHLYSDSIYMDYKGATADTHVDTMYSTMAVPLFVDIRYNVTTGGSIVPFVGVRAGYSLGIVSTSSVFDRVTGEGVETVKRIEKGPKGLGLYVSPSVGAKYVLGRSFAVNLSVGYTMQMRKYTTAKIVDGKTTGFINNGSMGGVTVKVGLEF